MQQTLFCITLHCQGSLCISSERQCICSFRIEQALLNRPQPEALRGVTWNERKAMSFSDMLRTYAGYRNVGSGIGMDLA